VKEQETLNTVQKAAEHLGLAPVTIRVWMASRRIGYVKLGRSVRVPQSEIHRLIEQGMTPAKAA
jgi:excisionase family DNA binding protein